MQSGSHARFSEKLERLKEQLNLQADQDVAAVLGMSKNALSVRKARGAFPDNAVLELQRSTHPQLDVDFVLFGPRHPLKEPETAMSTAELLALARRYERVLQWSAGPGYEDAISRPGVRRLLDLAVGLTDDALELLVKVAETARAAEANDQAASEAPQEPPTGATAAERRISARRARRGG